MVKKILSLALILVLTALPVSFEAAEASAFDDTQNSRYASSIDALAAFGLIQGDGSGSFHPENNITRAELVAILLRGIGIETTGQVAGQTPFADAAGHWAEGYIFYAHQIGMIDGISADYFGANESVTFNQAVKIITSLLGYKAQAEARGGYPAGYLIVADGLDLLDGLSSNERELKREEAAQIFYNALAVNVAYEINGAIKEGGTLLSSLGYQKLEGRVTGATDAQTTRELKPNQIEIGEKVYETTGKYKKKLIGSDVIFFVKEGDDSTIYYMKEKRNTNTVEIKDENISEATDLTSFRYWDGGKERREELAASGLSIFYNGKILTGADVKAEALRPQSGSVTLRDADGDGAYEIVIVTEVETVVVKSVVGDKIYGRYGETIDTALDRKQLEVEIGGREGAVAELSAGMVLTVTRSKDLKKVSICEGGETIEGTLVEIRTGEGEYVIANGEDENAYQLTPEYENALAEGHIDAEKPEAGEGGRFYLNLAGNIAAFEKDVQSGQKLKYGYLIEAGQSNGLQGSLKIRILTEENTIEVMETPRNGKISFGAVKDGGYKQNKEEGAAILPYLSKQGMITYQTDDEGYITELNCADNSTNSDYISIDAPSANCVHSQGLINQRYVIDGKTKVFCIPNAGQYDDIFSAGRYTDYFVNASYNLELYDIENNHIGAVLYTPTKVRRYVTANDGFETILDKVNSPVLYINRVSTVMEEDGEYLKITGYEDGREKSVLVGDMLNGRSEAKSRLKPGLVIQYETNTIRTSRALTSGEVPQMVIFKTLFDCTDVEQKQKMTYEYEDTYLVRPAISTIHSRISSVGSGYIGTELGKTSSYTGGTAVMVWRPGTEQFEPAGAAELALGQRVFIRQRYLVGREIVILED